ncbi:hypothetical protein GQ600_5467 [Phytophthora cactorum]|nr:hypothetical protein GQ600_5467 [Phytophthora cactorum]
MHDKGIAAGYEDVLVKAVCDGQLDAVRWTHYPEHHPSMVGKTLCTKNMPKILLFLHMHYPHVFTIWFYARLRRSLMCDDGT